MNTEIKYNGVTDDDTEKNYPECRKWLFTCNNPEQHGWSIEKIVEILENWKAVKYWCIGREVGEETGTPHIHFFIYSTSAIKATTIERKFHGINRKPRHKTIMQCRTYVFKDGKYLDTPKGKLHDYSSNRESGEPPEEKGRGQRTDLNTLYDAIKEGKSNFEILEEYPDAMKYFDKLDKVRQTIREEKFKNTWRDLTVTYVWGRTGTGKTRGIMDGYGYDKVYRVTDYDHPFDGYSGQDVIVFEEFRSNLRLGDMLKYLDGYPVEFPARYNNKVACFTKVYIVTNIDLRAQYPNEQSMESTSWEAFLRRIHKVKVYTGESVQEYETREYLDKAFFFFGKNPLEKENPFNKGGVK